MAPLFSVFMTIMSFSTVSDLPFLSVHVNGRLKIPTGSRAWPTAPTNLLFVTIFFSLSSARIFLNSFSVRHVACEPVSNNHGIFYMPLIVCKWMSGLEFWYSISFIFVSSIFFFACRAVIILIVRSSKIKGTVLFVFPWLMLGLTVRAFLVTNTSFLEWSFHEMSPLGSVFQFFWCCEVVLVVQSFFNVC